MRTALINLSLSALFLVGSAQAPAQTAPAQQQGPLSFEMSIKPASVPSPALRYRLMPAMYDLTPGNAAPIYYTAALIVPKLTDEQREQMSGWTSIPIDQLPRSEVNETMVGCESVFAQLDTAARREYCRWEPAFREQQFAALLAHLGPMRDAARALAVKARLQIADGKFEDAARSLQTGYAMAHHVQDGGALIQVLVGASMARLFDGVVRDWQGAANSPNLYWAIAELPRPFVDIAQSMRREQALLAQMFPLLKDPDHATAEQWQQMIGQWNQVAPTTGGSDASRKALEAAAITAMVLPAARAELIASGWDKAKVEALPPQQAAAIYCARQFRAVSDDFLKWLSAPYPLAAPGLKNAERRLDDASRPGTNPLLTFLPAISRAHANGAMIDREIAALQTIEAIRAYAAANNGALPRALTDLSDPPAVIDPMTGESFVYQSDGDSFTLEAIVIAGDNPRNGMRFEVTVKP